MMLIHLACSEPSGKRAAPADRALKDNELSILLHRDPVMVK